MVHAGVGSLDTPRTNVGDATYLSNHHDFDISQEQSFQSPSKDNNNLIQQLQNGRRGGMNLKTPRSRAALSERRNLPAGLGGGEFTPLLKSATRNSALRNGKENTIKTPAFLKPGALDNIPEDLSPLPNMGSSIYGGSRNGSYMSSTPMPHIDSSSTASTPMAILPRRNEGPGVLQDGNQLSLREQENVIDKIEKENFGLKLKIHFLEEALRKAGPGFSEAALKENTELKVDKVTMQKELHRYRKTLGAAERDVELYRQQVLEMQEKMKRKHMDNGQREDLERLREKLEQREEELNQLKLQQEKFEDLQDKVHDLEAEVRERNRLIEDREDDAENLKDEVDKQAGTISDLEETLKQAQRRAVELEEKAQVGEELEDAKEIIEELEQNLTRLRTELEEAKDDKQEAMEEKERAQADLEELQDEMANKSITTKGLSRQIEEKANRLQDELEDLREKHVTLEDEYADKVREATKLQDKIEDLKQDSEVGLQKLQNKLDLAHNENEHTSQEREKLSKRFDTFQKELQQKSEEKNILQSRHDALTQESAGLQNELAKAREDIENLEDKLDHEKTLALNNEREVRSEYKGEIDRLHDEIEDLRAEAREKERLQDDENDKWDGERRNLELQREVSEEKAAGLQRTIDRLQEAKGSLSSKETKLQEALQIEKDRHASQEALLTRQIEELNEDVEIRRKVLEEVRSDLSNVREELRLSQREQKALVEKVEALEDEVEVLQTSLDDESDQANQSLTAAKQESDSLRRQVLSLKQDISRAESATVSARAEAEAFHANSKSSADNKEQLDSALTDLEVQLSKIRQDKQALQDQVTNMKLEMHALRVSKAEAEAERDEIHSQVKSIQQQEEETFRLDQERVDLRTAKIKLDSEVRRLREEHKTAVTQQKTLEQELQQEIDRAGTEEARLTDEIHDLQKILRGSTEKRELASAKKTIVRLEERIRHLESQISSSNGDNYTAHELSIARHDLSAARQKETEYLQREAAQKDVVRGLKRQISELERHAHEIEVSRLASSSPRSSVSGSARKSEIIEVRAQLASAHESLRELRSQLKNAEKEASRKVSAIKTDLHSRTTTWESEKDEFERSLDEARFTINDLLTKNATSEATISRLREKIDRLENALQAERLNKGEDRTIVQERRELHELLRETQLERESLEVVVQERETTIALISAAEAELRKQLKRVRDERALHRSKAASAQEQLEILEKQFRESRKEWEAEKNILAPSHVKLEKIQKDCRFHMKRWEAEKHTLKASHSRLQILEREFEESKKAWQAERKNFGSAPTMLVALEKQFHESQRSWEIERKTHESAHTKLVTLEQQFLESRKLWEAEKKDLSSAHSKLQTVQRQFQESRKVWEAEKKSLNSAQTKLQTLQQQLEDSQKSWKEERKTLTESVRVATTSRVDESMLKSEISVLKKEIKERMTREGDLEKELRGTGLQVKWLTLRYMREKDFRNDVAHSKKYMRMELDLYESANKMNIMLFEHAGCEIKPRQKKPTIRLLALAIIATNRMKKDAAEWRKNTVIRDMINQQALKQGMPQLYR